MDGKSRRTQSIERLAAALQECFDAAVEEGTRRAEERMNERMDGFETRMDGFETRMNERMDCFERRIDHRLDRQDETLRMVWKQVKGEGPLPVDLHD